MTQRDIEKLLLQALERIQQLEENVARLESDVDCVKSIPVIDYSGEVVSWPDHRDKLYDDDL